jgi:hypothetical protein
MAPLKSLSEVISHVRSKALFPEHPRYEEVLLNVARCAHLYARPTQELVRDKPRVLVCHKLEPTSEATDMPLVSLDYICMGEDRRDWEIVRQLVTSPPHADVPGLAQWERRCITRLCAVRGESLADLEDRLKLGSSKEAFNAARQYTTFTGISDAGDPDVPMHIVKDPEWGIEDF